MRYFKELTLFLMILTLSAPAVAQQTKQWPPDAMDVSYTMAAVLSGQRGMSTISFAPGTMDYLTAAAFGEYTSFTRSRISPMFYQNYGTGNQYAAEVGGTLHLYDQYNRLATFQYTAQYTVNGKRINITQSLAAMTSPAKPAIETYMVPLAKFKSSIPANKRGDWPTVYQFAKDHAYDPRRDDKRDREYLVMSFVMNRLPDSAKFEVVVSTRKKARRALDNLAKKAESSLNFDGWRVHMFMGKFTPTSLRQRFYCNYYYTPGAGSFREGERTLVARYTSKPVATGANAPMGAAVQQAAQPRQQTTGAVPPPPQSYQPAPAQQQYASQPATRPRVTAAAPSAGPIERGVQFLNPLFPEDTATIQTRLRVLGHYSGSIDRDFGPMTQKALDSFAVKHGYAKGQWSLKLQKALFKGSGL